MSTLEPKSKTEDEHNPLLSSANIYNPEYVDYLKRVTHILNTQDTRCIEKSQSFVSSPKLKVKDRDLNESINSVCYSEFHEETENYITKLDEQINNIENEMTDIYISSPQMIESVISDYTNLVIGSLSNSLSDDSCTTQSIGNGIIGQEKGGGVLTNNNILVEYSIVDNLISNEDLLRGGYVDQLRIFLDERIQSCNNIIGKYNQYGKLADKIKYARQIVVLQLRMIQTSRIASIFRDVITKLEQIRNLEISVTRLEVTQKQLINCTIEKLKSSIINDIKEEPSLLQLDYFRDHPFIETLK